MVRIRRQTAGRQLVHDRIDQGSMLSHTLRWAHSYYGQFQMMLNYLSCNASLQKTYYSIRIVTLNIVIWEKGEISHSSGTNSTHKETKTLAVHKR